MSEQSVEADYKRQKKQSALTRLGTVNCTALERQGTMNYSALSRQGTKNHGGQTILLL